MWQDVKEATVVGITTASAIVGCMVAGAQPDHVTGWLLLACAACVPWAYYQQPNRED